MERIESPQAIREEHKNREGKTPCLSVFSEYHSLVFIGVHLRIKEQSANKRK